MSEVRMNGQMAGGMALMKGGGSGIGRVLALVLLLLGAVSAVSSAGGVGRTAQPPDAQSTSGPTPPAQLRTAGLSVEPAVSVTIPGVPPYLWQHGCGPTAAGMVIGYWDGQGYDALVPGDAGAQTAAVDEMIASEGPASNYTDYCEPVDSHPDLQPDKSELPMGDEHPDECVADYMKTSQSRYYNYYGWSWFSHVGPAMRSYTSQALKSSHAARTRNLYLAAWGGSLNWDSFRAEIDAGRPMVLLVDTDADGYTDHFVTAIGYGTTGSLRYYACLNTWDSYVHWFLFEPMAPLQPWGIYGGVAYELVPLDQHVYLPVVSRGS